MNNYEDISMVSQPKNFKTELFPHQLASIYNMEKLEREQSVIVNERTKRESNIGILSDLTGYGKCLGFDTPVLLYDGTIEKVQNIKVGDLLMGDDSTPRKVLSLARGRENMYTIKQDLGADDYVVNESHILSLKVSCTKLLTDCESEMRFQVSYFKPSEITFFIKNFPYCNNNKEEVRKLAQEFLESLTIDSRIDISVKEYLKLPTRIQKQLKGYRVSVDFSEKSASLDPFTLGVLIGVISEKDKTHDDEHEVFNNKSNLPPIYLRNSRDIRLAFLAGLIDVGGLYYNGMYEITHKYEQFAYDTVFLARSLGFVSYLYKVSKRNIIWYRVIITGTGICEIPTETISYVTNNTNCSDLCSNIQIIPKGEGDYYGFTIDGNHRFLLGDFTVTHNTASMIGLLVRDNLSWDVNVPYKVETIVNKAGGHIKNYHIDTYDRLPTTLILVSTSIVSQWQQELSKTNLKFTSILNKRDVDNVDPEDYEVMIVIPSMYNNLIMSHSNLAWKRFIFDEPGHIRVSGMKNIIAGFYWLVTATPEAILSKHRNCRNSFMFDIIKHKDPYEFHLTFDPLSVRNDYEFVKNSFNMPPTHHLYHECFQPVVNSVRGFVNNRINVMIEAGNIEGAILALGGCKTDNIVTLIKEKKQEELEIIETEIEILKIRNSDRIHEWIEKKIKIYKQILDIEKRFSERLKGTCNICLGNLTSPILEPNCQNLFCGECLLTWLQKNLSCPLCRAHVNTTKLTYIEIDNENKTPVHPLQDRNKTKEETIIEIINRNNDGKYIIFSDYDNTFKTISSILVENGIEYAEIKGTLTTKNKNLKRYKEGNLSVIFLNSTYNGSGLNLQETTDIILYHEMSDTTLAQVIGRANRIGRVNELYVHHLQVQG